MKKRRKLTEKHKKAISRANSGRGNPMYGRTTKGSWKKGHWAGSKNFNWKGGKTKCIDCGKFVGSISKRCRDCHISYFRKVVPRGKEHWSWNGGLTKILKKVRFLYKYKEWRMAVFMRDDYTCQTCGKRGNILNADHKKPLAILLMEGNIKTSADALNYNKLWDIENGQTLCITCHKKTDTYAKSFYSDYKYKERWYAHPIS